jgi:hypothetical protein
VSERDHIVVAFDRLDRARQLEAEQVRLAKRVAELEFEMQQRIADLERRYAESRRV